MNLLSPNIYDKKESENKTLPPEGQWQYDDKNQKEN